MLTPDSSGSNSSPILPPFNYSSFAINILDHYSIQQFLATELNFSSESHEYYFTAGQNVISTMANLGSAMTTQISQFDSNLSAKGIIWQQRSVIKIQFAWLALPLALVIFSAILLVLTSLMTRWLRVPLWKSSPLPLLYHGIQEWDDDEKRDIVEGRLEKVHTMEDDASLKRVRIFKSPYGGTWLEKS